MGQKLLDQIEGFRLYLSTAEEERLKVLHPPEKTPELFERYLPYALALDCENEWNAKFAAVLAARRRGGLRRPRMVFRPALGRGPWAAASPTAWAEALPRAPPRPRPHRASSVWRGSSGGGGFSGGGGGGGGGSGLVRTLEAAYPPALRASFRVRAIVLRHSRVRRARPSRRDAACSKALGSRVKSVGVGELRFQRGDLVLELLHGGGQAFRARAFP